VFVSLYEIYEDINQELMHLFDERGKKDHKDMYFLKEKYFLKEIYLMENIYVFLK